jgi:hypothetical protein
MVWLLKAKRKDKGNYKADIDLIHVVDGIYYSSDSVRLHCFLPDYDNIPNTPEYKLVDGSYKVLSSNKKQITLQFVEGAEKIDVNKVTTYRKNNKTESFNTESGTSSHFVNHVYRKTGKVFNYQYIIDGAEGMTGDIVIDIPDYHGFNSYISQSDEFTPVIFGNKSQFVLIMPLKQ